MPYSERVRELVPLESFDSAVFLADQNTPQNVCDFVLALALVYNDIRDIMLMRLLIQEVVPSNLEAPSAELGQYYGMETGILRLQAGVMRELLDLVKRNQAAITHNSFSGIVRKLSREAREAWQALAAVAFGKDESSLLAKALMFMRNKVAFHYDPKEISRSYQACFQQEGAEPLVSRGGTMGRTRFYFADAAAQTYMKEKGKMGDAEAELIGRVDGEVLLDRINVALYQIITRFPVHRGYAWRKSSA